MYRTVIGIFDNYENAKTGVDNLEEAGFEQSEISVLMRDDVVREHLDVDQAKEVTETAGAGAIGGTAVGGLIGLLAGASALMLPGVGAVLAAGTLATVFGTTAAGAGIGAAYGVFFGALIGLGMSEEEAHRYIEGVRQGRVLVTAVTDQQRSLEALRAMREANALLVDTYTLYARRQTGGQIGGLSTFVIAIGLAEVLSSPFWGRFSDRSSRTVMILGGSLAIVVGIVALALSFMPEGWQTPLVFAPMFLAAGFAQAGVRLGRKAYLVDGAPPTQRPLYVALSNTIIGVAILLSSAFGLVAEVFGVEILLAVFVGLTALGVLACWRMPEAEQMAA